MKRLWPIFFAMTVLIVPEVAAQKLIRGQTLDAATGEALPAANVQVEGTYRGTISNADGVYEIQLDQLPATLIVRFIGYKTAYRTITEDDEEESPFSVLGGLKNGPNGKKS